MITISGATVQLLDDSNLQAVAAAGQENASAAARMASERPGTMNGWVGGTWVSQTLMNACSYICDAAHHGKCRLAVP